MLKNVAVYEALVAYGLTALIPALMLPLYAVISVLNWSGYQSTFVPPLEEIARVFALALPLTTALSAAHLMGIEREENFDALRRSYAEPTWRLPFVRLCGALVLAALSVLLTVSILRIGGIDYPLADFVLPAVPATLFLLSLALLANNLSGLMPVALVAVVGYWFMEMQTLGEVTGALFLFHSVSPVADVELAQNHALLIAASVGLCLANIAWSSWRRRTGG